MGSRLEGLQRLLVIINKLEGKKRYVPIKELKRSVADAMALRGYSGVTLRTLQRDFKEIDSLFGISIKFDESAKGYYIQEEDEHAQDRYALFLQNFDLLNALEGDTNLRTYVLAEHHRPLPSECRRRYESAHVCAGGASPSVAERVSSDADSRYQAYSFGYFPLYFGKAGR